MNKLSKTHKCCILCLKSPIKVPGLKLHRFPKILEKRNVWLNACGLKADEYLPYGKLCSRHFDESCYNKSGFRLKVDAIPTKQLKGKIIQPFFRLSEDKTLDLTSKNDESTSKNDKLTSKNDELTIPNHTSTPELQTTRTVLSIPSTPELQTTQTILSIPSTPELQTTRTVLSIPSTPELQTTQTILSIPSTPELQTTQTVLSIPSTPELQETPKKQELKSPDFATPRRARKNWNLAKTQIKIQQNKIKILNQKVRRLKNKLSSLELLMKHLKQKK